MTECTRMRRWLDNMHKNLIVLAAKYERYCDAAETAGDLAKDVADCMECFKGCSRTALLFKEYVVNMVENQQSIFSESRGKLEDLVSSFWVSQDALRLHDGSLKKDLSAAGTGYCVSVARALATANKDSYEREIQKSVKEANFYGLKRWDFVVACENVALQREIDLDQAIVAMLDAQKEATEEQQRQLAEVADACTASQEAAKLFADSYHRGLNEQEQYRTRLGLHAADVRAGGVVWSANTRRVEGMMFTLPARKPGASAKRNSREVWLPVWGWVETDWQTFNFNAEWQGPIPGMSKAEREQVILNAQMDLDKCTARGLDGDGLPPMGKNGRIFTFEVEYETAGTKVVHKFQALSSADIQKWKTAYVDRCASLP